MFSSLVLQSMAQISVTNFLEAKLLYFSYEKRKNKKNLLSMYEKIKLKIWLD
jgi:hypothetical protein